MGNNWLQSLRVALCFVCITCVTANSPQFNWRAQLDTSRDQVCCLPFCQRVRLIYCMTWQVQRYTQTVMSMIESAQPEVGRRDSMSAMCSSFASMDVSMLSSMASQSSPGVPSDCVTPVLTFFKDVICSAACENSPLVGGLSGNSSSRRLLGGTAPTNPTATCTDPCYSPFTTGFIAMIKTVQRVTSLGYHPLFHKLTIRRALSLFLQHNRNLSDDDTPL